MTHPVVATIRQNMRSGHGRKEAIVLAARRHGMSIDTVLALFKASNKK